MKIFTTTFLLTLSLFSFSYAQEHSKIDSSKHDMGKHSMINMNSSDKRTPVLMTTQMSAHQLTNMRDHLEAIQEIIETMSKKDFDGMKKASSRIASSPSMTMMCEHMGKGTPGYTEMGLAFHKSGDQLVHYASKKDYDSFVKQLGKTLQSCTSCHSSFKQEIVPDHVFQKLQK